MEMVRLMLDRCCGVGLIAELSIRVSAQGMDLSYSNLVLYPSLPQAHCSSLVVGCCYHSIDRLIRSGSHMYITCRSFRSSWDKSFRKIIYCVEEVV